MRGKKKQPVTVDGVVHWPCSTCKRLWPEAAFAKNKSTPNGLQNHCARCQRAYDKVAGYIPRAHLSLWDLARRRRWSAEQRERDAGEVTRCRNALTRAVKSGKIQRPDTCSDCGKGSCQIQGHHEDYSKPLDVIWLCRVCHGRLHRKVVMDGLVPLSESHLPDESRQKK